MVIFVIYSDFFFESLRMNVVIYCAGIFAGPGTVFCDYTSYVFMFLSIATSNLVATSLARKV